MNMDQCYPEYYQMDESMGTYMVPLSSMTTQAAPTTSRLCAELCETTSNCIFSTWNYTTTLSETQTNINGSCFTYVLTGSDRLAFKALPTDYVSGESHGAAAVTSGSYVIYTGDSTTMVGEALDGGVSSSEAGCRIACDSNVECIAYYWVTTPQYACTLRKGMEGEGLRTFINIDGSKVE